MQNLSSIREHMEVIGADGVHIGTVDHVEGDRIKLTKADSGEGHHQGHHHFVPGFPQMAWPMVEWVLDTHYRNLFDRDRWREASILVYEAGESQLIGAMEAVGAQFSGVKVFSLPSMGPKGERVHVELGVRGDPAQVDGAIDSLRAMVGKLGFPYKENATK